MYNEPDSPFASPTEPEILGAQGSLSSFPPVTWLHDFVNFLSTEKKMILHV